MREELRSRGYLVIEDLVGPAGLDVLRGVVARLEAMAAEMSESTDDVVLEAEGVGGWVAWQQGAGAAAGVLRSVSRAHQYCPELVDLAQHLADSHVSPATGGPVTMINTFLWAKPAQLGSEKPWHQDMAFAPKDFEAAYRNVVTVWVAVDPATAENGCLEFVPSSHVAGVLPHIGDEERSGDEPRHVRPVEPHVDPAALATLAAPVLVPLSPGSAALFDGFLVHRSAPNTSVAPRRAVSFVYAIPRTATGS